MTTIASPYRIGDSPRLFDATPNTLPECDVDKLEAFFSGAEALVVAPAVIPTLSLRTKKC